VVMRRASMVTRRPSGARGFLPRDLGGLVLWLRSDLGITLNAGNVSAWADQSGNGNNATQGTAAKQPAYVASDAGYGGRPTLSFASASAQLMTLAANLPAQPFTAYVVGESTSGAAQQEFFGDATNNVTLFWTGTVWGVFAGAGFNSANATRTKQAFATVFNGVSSSLYINASSAAAATGNAGASNPAGGEAIGGEAGPTANALNGKIAELAVYSGAHTASQVRTMFSYFASMYAGAWS
jgi:hypothetical protein